MKFSLYGLPCSGKTTILNGLKIPVIHGSAELNKLSEGRFDQLSEEEKREVRVRYAEQLSRMSGSIISDGHYSFLDDVVFTEADANLYDVFIYLYCEPEIIRERLSHSAKNTRFADLSDERIRKWQYFEIEGLRNECHKRNKDFYVVRDISTDELQDFIEKIEDGFSSYSFAEKIADYIRTIYPEPCELHICDGDKTIIKQDSFRLCTNGYMVHSFYGNFYTGFQSLGFTHEVQKLSYDFEKLDSVELNDMIMSRMAGKNYVILSSGIKEIWEPLSARLGLKNVIADTMISADTKYFVVKLLQESGYRITAYGDGKNDLYMLKKADESYLYIGKYMSRSLKYADTSGIRLLYDKSTYILSEKRDDISEDIDVCKSSSGINGSRLAAAHIRLGQLLGESIKKLVPDDDAAVLVLERGGRFFGDGLYAGFGGKFYSYDPKKDEVPNISQGVAIIVDSVINTGKSVIDIIDRLKSLKPDMEIFIATNVIQQDAVQLLSDYKVFAVRTSANSFVGSRQQEQKDGKGPDTADRLFNYID